VDLDLKVIRANRAIEQWSSYRVEQIQGKNLHDLLHPNCRATPCYLLEAFQLSAAQQLNRTVQVEALDPNLNRNIRLFIRPIHHHGDDQARTAVVLMSDITELKMAEGVREDLIADLDAFAHTVAHDLKNPIGIIIGYADLLTQAETLPLEDQHHALRTISRIARKMNNIVEELMLFSQVRSADVVKKPLDMSAILHEVLHQLEYDPRRSQAEIVLMDSWPTAWGHAPWVEEVWVNLITNALKYGGTPPRVELGGEQLTAETARFWVRDNGSGISPDLVNRLFSPLTHLPHTRADGHGLGLSIVRRIVEKLGGRVSVESNQAARPGSIFYFTLSTGQG
jgi:signal transduction histidine kinase